MCDILQLELQTCGLREKLQPHKERIIFSICEKSKTLTKTMLPANLPLIFTESHRHAI